mgnify:CR=1 FL=1
MRSRITRELLNWEKYVQEMSSKFGDYLYDDPMSELMSLRQKGMVRKSQAMLGELLNRLKLPKDYAINCFLSGLKEEIQLAVRMFMPKSLHHAQSLAIMKEAKPLYHQKGK